MIEDYEEIEDSSSVDNLISSDVDDYVGSKLNPTGKDMSINISELAHKVELPKEISDFVKFDLCQIARINDDDIISELRNQPVLQAKFSALKAEAKRKADNQKATLTETVARVTEQIYEEKELHARKWTAPVIQAKIDSHQAVIEHKERLIEYEYYLEMLTVAHNVFNQRSQILLKLASFISRDL